MHRMTQIQRHLPVDVSGISLYLEAWRDRRVELGVYCRVELGILAITP